MYFFEEIDNGIHPARLHLLIDLIESQTKSNGIQVITTTHSPEMLNLINDDTFKNTSVVYRDEESSDAVIRPAADLPNAKRLRKSKGLGPLHSTGWMEDMLAFAEAMTGRLARGRRVKVLIIPEDFRNDQYILKPLFSRLFRSLGRGPVRVRVCQDLLGGVGEALKAERLAEIVQDVRRDG